MNLKISCQDDIFCKIKKFGIIIYSLHLRRKNYYSSDIYQFLKIDYDHLIKIFDDDNSEINLKISEFFIFIDNKNKIIKISD